MPTAGIDHGVCSRQAHRWPLRARDRRLEVAISRRVTRARYDGLLGCDRRSWALTTGPAAATAETDKLSDGQATVQIDGRLIPERTMAFPTAHDEGL